MDNTQEYTFKELCGLKVIVWRHIGCESKIDKTIKKHRKQLKDRVGSENLETPTLDLRQYNDNLQYCDIIMCT